MHTPVNGRLPWIAANLLLSLLVTTGWHYTLVLTGHGERLAVVEEQVREIDAQLSGHSI